MQSELGGGMWAWVRRSVTRGQSVVVQQRTSTSRWRIGAGRTTTEASGGRFGTPWGAAGHAGTWCRSGGARGVAVFDHQVNRHLALERSDVTLAEVVAQFMHLREDGKIMDTRRMLISRYFSVYINWYRCYINTLVTFLVTLAELKQTWLSLILNHCFNFHVHVGKLGVCWLTISTIMIQYIDINEMFSFLNS